MLGNAAVAAVLALIALAVGLVVRSPAVRHATWLIVLLKLLAPPLVIVPLNVLPPDWAAHLEAPTDEEAGASATLPCSASAWSWISRVAEVAIGVCLLGTVYWFVLQGRKILRFHRRVAAGTNAPPEVTAAAARLASALGIARPPEVKIVAGIGSPMLWGRGRGAVILFPGELLERLTPEARDTLLAHELAHLRRCDHWVRLLEYVVTGLYWWHPAVWLARRGIEAAEEECCDAWVVGGLSASARRYAEALLETVNFQAELRRPRLPPGACAAHRNARLLQHRLLQIINARPPRHLRGAVAIWVLAAAALVTQPALRASAPGLVAPDGTADAVEKSAPHRTSRPKQPRTPPKPREPRAWATATAPGGALTVFARDTEFILRQPDGTSRVLGPGRPLAVSFAQSGKRLATVGPRGVIRTWDGLGNLLGTTSLVYDARAVSYLPDGTRVLVLDTAGNVTVLDAESLAPLGSWPVDGPANSIACDPTGKIVAVAFGSWLGETGWVELWSVAERRRIACLPASAPAAACRFSPDGRTLVIGSWNGLTSWRSLPGGEVVAERMLPKDFAANTAFCPEAGTLPLEPPPEPSVTGLQEWVQNPVQAP
jgi:beta-lactamase regulating signal transducer with metallopeptidase domain